MPSSFFDATDDLPPISYHPDMAKLLSASSYPHAPSVSTSNRSETQYYGGIVPVTESGEEEEEIDQRPRKKPKSSNSSDMYKDVEPSQKAPKRQRGRPKVSTKDETAAERRRTQIRLAQRAYRNRKENTITELTQKVEGLQAVMRNVNIGFAKLRENLLNSGMVHADSAVAQQVEELMQTLTEALEAPASDMEKTSEEDEDVELQGQVTMSDHSQFETTGGRVASVAFEGQTYSATSGPAVDIHSNLLGIGTDHDFLDLERHNLTDLQNYPAQLTNYLTSSASKRDQTLTLSPSILPNNHLAWTSVERFPGKKSYTYSFQEVTFARRLQRLCIERTFHKLMDPRLDPDWLLKKFRFTLTFANKERITNVFKALLTRGTDEPLENWRTPFVHIGGAGLHFPRRDANGQPVYPPNLLSPFLTQTPWKLPGAETLTNAETLEELLESIGFGGEWFDSHDVEEYLKTKGIFPDAQASFMVVDSNLAGLPLLPNTAAVETITSASGSQSPVSAGISHNEDQIMELPLAEEAFESTESTLTNTWLDRQGMYQVGDFELDFLRPQLDVAARETRLLTIEVEKFLEKLTDDAVCLGRAPGFRKEHVDNALMAAMQEAF